MRNFLACVALSLLAPHAWAGWLPGGTRVSANQGHGFSATTDGSGGVIVCWQEVRNGLNHVIAQRVTPAGEIAPGWPADGLSVYATAAQMETRAIADDGAGGAIIVWDDSRSAAAGQGPPGIYALRITGDGALAVGWPATGVGVHHPSDCSVVELAVPIVGDGNGGAIVCSRRYPVPGGPHGCPISFSYVHAQHVSGAGAADWSTTFSEYGVISGPNVAADVAGGAILTLWSRISIPPYAVRVTASGQIVPGWPVDVTSEPQLGALDASDGTGGAFFAWGRWNPTTGRSEVYAQHLLADGGRAPGWPEVGLQVVTGDGGQGPWAIAPDGFGGAMVGWSKTPVAGSESDLHMQRITAGGTPAPGWDADGVPVCVASGNQYADRLVPDGLGGVWVCWLDLRSGDYELFATRLTAQGALAPGWHPNGTRISSTPISYPSPVIVPSSSGTAIVVWSDRRKPGSAVYAQRLVGDGPVPVAMDLVSVVEAGGFVRLTGSIAQGAGVLVTVLRRIDGGEPEAIASLYPDGSGRIEHVDRNVVPGVRYGYRLSAQGGGEELHTREIWVEIPEPHRLAIEPIRPNPSVGALAVTFTLPGSDDAALELLDLAGRRHAARQVGSLGTGRKTVEFPEVSRLSPGLYLARLSQGGRSLSVKFCVMR